MFSTLPRLARSKSISFIGLGRMGSQMAINLFSKSFAADPSFRFVVCDAVPQSVLSFKTEFERSVKGAGERLKIVNTPREAVEQSGTIITMLPSSPQVRTVYTDDNGIIPALHALPSGQARDTLCIDSTTLDVQVARDVAQSVNQTGASMTDAPVSGGVSGAQAGTLSFLVGGTSSAFALSQPSLQKMGQRIIHCGPSGSGLAAKICNNLVLGVQQIVVAEAMLLGQEMGLDEKTLAGVINSSTGACWACAVNNPVKGALPDKTPPCERDYEGGFATALMIKDLGLATNIGNSWGVPLHLGEAAETIYGDVTKQHPELASKDFSSVYLFLKEAAERMKKAQAGGLP